MTNGPPSWNDIFWEFLCRMYKTYGGDCRDLPKFDLSSAITEAVSLYNTNGNPTFDTNQERLDFLALLDDMDAHLALPENTLSDADNGTVTQLVADLKAGASSSP